MKVMVSYSRTDAAFVARLVRFLQRRGINPWIDRGGITPGQPWRESLLEQLRTCDACILVLSPAYLKSEYCRMEAFLARSFERKIVPVMVKNCFDTLDSHEETRGLPEIFMMRMYRLDLMGLEISVQEAMQRVTDAIVSAKDLDASSPVYISYPNYHGNFATQLARSLENSGIKTWVATQDVRVGENWRDAQARAILRSLAQIVILSTDMLESHVLRTEILLAEARGLPVYTVLPPEFPDPTSPQIRRLMQSLNSADETYRRLTATQFFVAADGLKNVTKGLVALLSAGKGRLRSSNRRLPRRR